jgi:SAM-dependent methyltransferase
MNNHRYDNVVGLNNVYDHTLELLRRNLGEGEATDGGVHLDIACGFGRIAESVSEQFGVEYVGVDVEDAGLDNLRSRGFEAHQADLSDDGAKEALLKVLDGRRLVSLTCLDGLEHMVEGRHLLDAVGDLLAEHRAVAVFSVPNVSHLDVSIKNLLGNWQYTPTGLLDSTHFQLYTARSLELALGRSGLRRIDSFDVVLAESDQHFPSDHTALSPQTAVYQWLRKIRDRAEPHGLTNQFVWAVTAVPPQGHSAGSDGSSEPFLSVIMRTQGRRPQELREAMLCLAGQTNADFEVIVVAHKTTIEEQKAVERVIEDQPQSIRDRIRLFVLDVGRRAAPLNLGLKHARGRYVGIFDDDDLVLGNWVQSFASAEPNAGGRLIRAVSLCQDVRHYEVRGVIGVRGEGSPKRIHNLEFLLSEHLYANQSPTLGWVFPRSLNEHLGLVFDESMTTTEDWEFLLQAAELAGVLDVPRAVAIYQWWIDRESSKTLHKQEEWAANQREVERRVDAQPLLLPAGESRALRRDQLRLKELERLTKMQERQLGKAARRISVLERRNTKLKRQRDLALARWRRQQHRRRAQQGATPGRRMSRPFAASVRRAKRVYRRVRAR